MTPTDMAALHARCFTDPPPWTAEAIAALLAQPSVFAVFQADGFLMGRVIADEAEILTLAVNPASQGRGIGKQLVSGFLSEAQARGATSAFLEVSEDNSPAKAVYAGAGFVEVGRRRGYYRTTYGEPRAALILRRALV